MQTVKDFSETNAGRRCTFKYRDFLSREGVYTGRIVGYYESFHAKWVLVEPDINIGENRNNTAGDTNFHWRETCQRYMLIDIDGITVSAAEEKDKPWPHRCNCGQPAFIVFRTIECSSYICKNYTKRFG